MRDCRGKNHRLEEQGSPSGVARRVILRELEIWLILEPRKLIHQGQCDPIFYLSLALISILMSLCPTYDLRWFRKNWSRLNLRSSNGTTGAGQCDFIAQNEPAGFHEARIEDIHHFPHPGGRQNSLKY